MWFLFIDLAKLTQTLSSRKAPTGHKFQLKVLRGRCTLGDAKRVGFFSIYDANGMHWDENVLEHYRVKVDFRL